MARSREHARARWAAARPSRACALSHSLHWMRAPRALANNTRCGAPVRCAQQHAHSERQTRGASEGAQRATRVRMNGVERRMEMRHDFSAWLGDRLLTGLHVQTRHSANARREERGRLYFSEI